MFITNKKTHTKNRILEKKTTICTSNVSISLNRSIYEKNKIPEVKKNGEKYFTGTLQFKAKETKCHFYSLK